MAHPVLIFDSGIGARAVDMALKARMPTLNTVLLEDTEGFPYGNKPNGWVEGRVLRLLEQAVQTHTPSAVVVACNTASFCAGARLTETLPCPVHLTFPPLSDAVRLTATRHLGILVTPLTAAHPAFKRRLQQIHAAGLQTTIIAETKLAEMAENYIKTREIPDLAQLQAMVLPLAASSRLDVCVLGCTHYGFLRPLIERAVGRELTFLDSAEHVAQRILGDLKQTARA